MKLAACVLSRIVRDVGLVTWALGALPVEQSNVQRVATTSDATTTLITRERNAATSRNGRDAVAPTNTVEKTELSQAGRQRLCSVAEVVGLVRPARTSLTRPNRKSPALYIPAGCIWRAGIMAAARPQSTINAGFSSSSRRRFYMKSHHGVQSCEAHRPASAAGHLYLINEACKSCSLSH